MGIRTCYSKVVMQIKNDLPDIPVIGIIKQEYEGSDVYITPTIQEVDSLLNAGCEVIALDCTRRPRPRQTLEELVKYIRRAAPEVEIMADCDCMESAEEAAALGFDYIGTTMRGYTAATKGVSIPDYDFDAALVKRFPDVKIIGEGGIWEREQLKKVWDTGVYAVVIGSSITRPMDITKRFVQVIK